MGIGALKSRVQCVLHLNFRSAQSVSRSAHRTLGCKRAKLKIAKDNEEEKTVENKPADFIVITLCRYVFAKVASWFELERRISIPPIQYRLVSRRPTDNDGRENLHLYLNPRRDLRAFYELFFPPGWFSNTFVSRYEIIQCLFIFSRVIFIAL